jgi:hypothetical protein
MREAITEVLGDASLAQRIGTGARASIEATCSLASVVEREVALLEEI